MSDDVLNNAEEVVETVEEELVSEESSEAVSYTHLTLPTTPYV